MLSLSTLTVSSINSGAPGVAAYSTLNVSSMNAMSSITTSSITTSSIITAPGYNSNISNVLYTSLADSGKTAADLITTGMPATAPSGSVISGSYRATAASGDARISMRLAYTFVVGTTYNFTFTGMQGSTDLGLRVYQYNTAGNLYTQIDQNVGPVSTTPTTITGSFTPSASGLYTGTIIFYIQALSLNPYVNFTSFRMTVGSMNVGIGMSNPIAKLQITQDGNSVLNEVGSHSMGILSSQGTSGTNLMYMMMDADYTNQCCSIQSIIYGLKVWNLNLNPRGGNVGIGTTNPVANLHIHNSSSSFTASPTVHIGDGQTDAGGTYGMLQLVRANNAADNKAHISFIKNGLTLFGMGYYPGSNISAFGLVPSFSSMATTNGLWLLTNGNVGIGITNPSYKLDVVGDARASGSLIIGTGGTYTPGCIFANGDWGMILRAYTASPAVNKFLVSDNADTHLFGIDLNNRLYISQTLRGSTTTRNSGIARLTINSDYNDSATGFAINASDTGNTTDDYTMKLYPYVVAGGIVGYAFGTLNGTTNYTPFSFNRNLVGINNTSPSYPLDVVGDIRTNSHLRIVNPADYDNLDIYHDGSAVIYNGNGAEYGHWFQYNGTNKVYIARSDWGALNIINTNDSWTHFGHVSGLNYIRGHTVMDSHYLSIGTSTVRYPLYITNGANWYWYLSVYMNWSGVPAHNNYGTWPVSIWTENAIVTTYWFGTVSDQRIKKNIQPVGSMLETINKIEIMSFDFIDSANNKRDECGVIAQQIESVFPNAVDTSNGIIPCYLTFATSQYVVNDDAHILFDYDHSDTQQQFKVGDKIKIHAGQKTDTIDKDKGSHHVVVKSIIDGGFTTEKWKDYEADDGVFVYGKEVDDFRNVDKEQLGILALKGVQELSSMVSTLQAANATLESQVAALSASYASLLSRLEALEAR
jgi:hypothetical protein